MAASFPVFQRPIAGFKFCRNAADHLASANVEAITRSTHN